MEQKPIYDRACSAQEELRTVVVHMTNIAQSMNPAKIQDPVQSVDSFSELSGLDQPDIFFKL